MEIGSIAHWTRFVQTTPDCIQLFANNHRASSFHMQSVLALAALHGSVRLDDVAGCLIKSRCVHSIHSTSLDCLHLSMPEKSVCSVEPQPMDGSIIDHSICVKFGRLYGFQYYNDGKNNIHQHELFHDRLYA
jgi:hypothetical protein